MALVNSSRLSGARDRERENIERSRNESNFWSNQILNEWVWRCYLLIIYVKFAVNFNLPEMEDVEGAQGRAIPKNGQRPQLNVQLLLHQQRHSQFYLKTWHDPLHVDLPKLRVAARDMVEKRTYTLLGSIATVLLVDKIVLNRFFPRIRFKKWRLTANLIKFIVWPMAIAQPI